MHLKIDPDKWARARQFFLDNPTLKKFIPEEESYYCFIRGSENKLYAVPRKKFQYLYTLGEGSFGKVVSTQDETGKNDKASKIIDPDHVIPDDHSIEVMKHLGIFVDRVERPKKNPKKKVVAGVEREVKNKAYIFMKRAPGKSLLEYYNEETGEINLSELQIDMVALKCCLALLEYHEKRVVHGDLNAGNIMLDTSDGDIKITLVDQGFSLILSPEEKGRVLQAARGTKPFAAPELYSHRYYSFESDLYALGVIFECAKRKEWASHLMRSVSSDRYSLYEMMSLILQKISRDNETLPPAFEKTYNFADEIMWKHYEQKLEQGMTLEALLRGQVYKLFFDEVEVRLLVLNFCQAYHMSLQNDPNAKIFGLRNFTVKYLPEKTQISFNIDCRAFNLTVYPKEYWTTKVYTEKTAVYIFGKILEALEVPPGMATYASAASRPSLLDFMSNMCASIKDQVPLKHAASFTRIEQYIARFDEENASDESISPSLTQSPELDCPLLLPSSESEDEKENSPGESMSSGSKPGSEDDLSRFIKQLTLNLQSPSMLNQFNRRTTPSPAGSYESLLKASYEEQEEDRARFRM